MKEPVFPVGQTVRATGPYNGWLTPGKLYTVTAYDPPGPTPTPCWPAYVTVMGDDGKPVAGHTYRFEAVEP